MSQPFEPGKSPVLPIVESSSPSEKSRKMRRTTTSTGSRLKQNIDSNYADLICVVLCFLTGLCDSSAFNAWSCFLAMQTGNTIVLGLGASNLPRDSPYGWLKSLVSISCFLSGSFCFSRAGRWLGPTRRGTLFASFMAQVALIVIAVALIQAGLIPQPASSDVSSHQHHPLLDLIPIGLLAFQSAGSINSTRSLGYNEIPSVVITSVYFDIASDMNIFAGKNVKRNRRVAGVVMLLIGAIVGGWLNRSDGGMASTFWLAAGIKFLIGCGWLVWAPVKGPGEGN